MLSIYILISLKAVISDEKESKVLWQLNSPFLFYVNMKAATISILIEEF